MMQVLYMHLSERQLLFLFFIYCIKTMITIAMTKIKELKIYTITYYLCVKHRGFEVFGNIQLIFT